MSVPDLDPKSQTSAVVLPATGTLTSVTGTLPYGIYSTSGDFVSGAADQVAYVYKKLGGDVLDLEITEGNVYASYEEAVLEYSYLMNIHQSKNVLSDFLGNTTGTFDQDGELKDGDLKNTLSGTHVTLKFPEFNFGYARRVADGISEEANIGGNSTVYSASIETTANVQDYDLQTIVESASADVNSSFYGKVGENPNFTKVLIKRVFYKTPRAMWRFYGYYGGLNTVGNLSNYGQYTDDSTFEVIPVWQNKLQAMAYEDALYTRLSHWSYELRNNKIRLFPIPSANDVKKIWFEFTVPSDSFTEGEVKIGMNGINNMNTLPLANIPYENINSIGKQWIRRFALSLAKETLGQVRSKIATIPIPGESVTLNGPALISEAKEEQEKLREELKGVLDELTYSKLMESDAGLVDNANKIQEKIPLAVYVG
jgi:hypothetical protein